MLEHQTLATEELNIDYVARERFGKLGKLWSRLNVAELVAPILRTRDPNAKCISWKLVFFVQADGIENQNYNLASKWLHAKLMGSDMVTYNDLLVSLPDLSIWKKWNSTQSRMPEVCCLSIIREARLGEDHPVSQLDHVAGSSCLLFLASGSISWDVQIVQLRKLLMSIPSGASLPLLILYNDIAVENIDDPSVFVINRLGLQEVDKTKISAFSVISLYGSSGAWHIDRFDDDHLKEGLQWLANHSPLQPMLQVVNTRELALGYVRRSISVLENLKAADMAPNHCVSAFNEALDRTAEEITAAASANPNCWPSPEINLLDESSDERLVAEMYLPCVGWSSAGRIEPIVKALKACKLAGFPNDMSWLNEGSSTVDELQSQRLAIEKCLANYLTESTQLLNSNLAVKEASIMVQKGAGLVLRGSRHYIVPRWTVIFRRIYNWQLSRLRGKEVSEAYILPCQDRTGVSEGSVASPTSSLPHIGTKDLENDFGSEGYRLLHSAQPDITFDELAEISCSLPFTEKPVASVSERSPDAGHESISLSATNISNGDDSHEIARSSNSAHKDVSPMFSKNELILSPAFRKSMHKLDSLVDECTQVQDRIDGRLCFYF